MAITKPQYTQISNEFIDKYMNKLSKEAVCVFIAISRKTIGWHKETDCISQSQLLKMTPIKSINGLKKAIKELRDCDLIIVEQLGTGKATKTIYEINMSQGNISQDDIKNIANMSYHDIKKGVNVSCHDTTKESNIKKINKERPNHIFVKYKKKKPIHEQLCIEYQKIHFEKLLVPCVVKEKHYIIAKKISDSVNTEKERQDLLNRLIKIIPDFFEKKYWFNTKDKKNSEIDRSSLNIGVFLAHCLEILADSKTEQEEQKKRVCPVCGKAFDYYISSQTDKCNECFKKEIEEDREKYGIPDLKEMFTKINKK